jgi:uncharacterized protein (DUF362 family)
MTPNGTGCSRRKWMKAVQGMTGAALAMPAFAQSASSQGSASRLTMPGPYRGKVVAVEHPRSIVSGAYQREPVREMLRTGLMKLTGASDLREAWRVFVQPGDVVGIKLNPVGRPHVVSAPEVVQEIIAGLREAGIKPQDIIAYDRYRREFLQTGFDKWLPEKVRWSFASEQYDEVQQKIEGYDPDVYADVALTLPGQDIGSLTARRSFAARFITKDVNKLINLCLLKDHQSAGVTLALKNLSHGLVNNVNRSHSTYSLNACGTFIPAIVSLPVIRQKAVLHIMDGVKGLYHGGPSAKPQFVWEHKAMYFATDPVAMDRIGWEIIDAKRVSVGMAKLVDDKPDQFSHFVHRQPEHVEIAGAMGLGEWDRKKIQLERVTLG